MRRAGAPAGAAGAAACAAGAATCAPAGGGAAGRPDGIGTAGGAAAAAGFAAAGTAGAAGFTTAGAAGAAGFVAARAAGRGAGGAGVVCLVMAFSTSPGLEILERSILVLISLAAGRAARFSLAEDAASAWPRKWRRTFSASSAPMELECVFFSLTPISGRRSRTALALTSSSRARSLMRTFSMRPLFPPGRLASAPLAIP